MIAGTGRASDWRGGRGGGQGRGQGQGHCSSSLIFPGINIRPCAGHLDQVQLLCGAGWPVSPKYIYLQQFSAWNNKQELWLHLVPISHIATRVPLVICMQRFRARGWQHPQVPRKMLPWIFLWFFFFLNHRVNSFSLKMSPSLGDNRLILGRKQTLASSS